MGEEISLAEYKKAYREIVAEDEKRGFLTHLVVYVLVNAMLTAHYLWGVRWLEKELKKREAMAEYRAREVKKGMK